jgi:Ras-related protein Rab-18
MLQNDAWSNTLNFILVYDVTKRESFSNLADVWTKEIEANSTNKDCIKMLVGNKVDKVTSMPET